MKAVADLLLVLKEALCANSIPQADEVFATHSQTLAKFLTGKLGTSVSLTGNPAMMGTAALLPVTSSWIGWPLSGRMAP